MKTKRRKRPNMGFFNEKLIFRTYTEMKLNGKCSLTLTNTSIWKGVALKLPETHTIPSGAYVYTSERLSAR